MAGGGLSRNSGSISKVMYRDKGGCIR